jgi:hypothetical protein
VNRERARLLTERMARQGIAAPTPRTVADAATVAGPIQAQDNIAARFGIRARSASVTEADVVAALEAGAVSRTWLMRGTIHLVDTADLRWLVRLLGPSVQRRFRSRWRQLGLTDQGLALSLQLLPDLLAGRALTRHEIVAGLRERGLPIVDTDPHVATHLVVHACTTGLVCRGPDRGRHTTFVLVDEWAPGSASGPSGDEALAELARRFFAAFSPATAADFAAWSGLGAARAVQLVRDELTETDVDGRAGFRLGEVEPARGLRLLPAFDNYLIGYRFRDALLGADLRPHVYSGGMIYPTLVVDGQVAGVWTLHRSAQRVTVRVFGSLRAAERRALAAEVDDLARFLDCPVRLDSVGEF